MDTKPCKECRRSLPLDEFYRHPEMADGHLNVCKDCKRAYTAERQPGYRARGYRGWQTEKGRDGIMRRRERYPERHSARQAVWRAKKSGKLVPGPCEIGVDCRGRIEAHHDDYAKPLAVRWVCARHHRVLD